MPSSRSATAPPGAPARLPRVGTNGTAPAAAAGAGPGTGTGGVASISSLAAGVRRTLFQAQLTRRPTPANSRTNSANSSTTSLAHGASAASVASVASLSVPASAASASGSTERLRGTNGGGGGGGGGGGCGSGGIIGRMPDVDVLSDTSEIVIRDEHGEAQVAEPAQLISPEDLDDGELEAREERQKLTDAVLEHQRNYAGEPEQPEELLDAVRASLREKVASLSDDHWMFEPDDHVMVR